MYRTPDQVALEIIAEGRRQGITPRGIVIAIATGLVESNLVVYANAKVPGSLALPHDKVGSDGLSVGPLQQQVRRGNGGAWWWGPVEVCQDPTGSARLFFQRLARTAYDRVVTDAAAGAIAQQIQQSAFPTRYAERMTEARGIYDRLAGAGQNGGTVVPDYGITQTKHGFNPDTPANATGNSFGPRARTDFVIIHTEEGNSTAPGLADYCNSHGLSYNLIVDDRDTVENVPANEAPWAAVEANTIGVHICFAGSRAAWTREQWLARGAALDRAAKATAAACQQYGVPIGKIPNGAGWNGTRGLAAHGDFGARGGGHTDPGPNFPWDDFIARVKRFTNPNPGGTPMPTTDQNVQYIAGQLGPWPQLGTDSQGRPLTLVDAVAAMKTEQAEQGRILRALAAAAGVKL